MKRQLKTSVDLFDFETACGSGTGVELGLVLCRTTYSWCPAELGT